MEPAAKLRVNPAHERPRAGAAGEGQRPQYETAVGRFGFRTCSQHPNPCRSRRPTCGNAPVSTDHTLRQNDELRAAFLALPLGQPSERLSQHDDLTPAHT